MIDISKGNYINWRWRLNPVITDVIKAHISTTQKLDLSAEAWNLRPGRTSVSLERILNQPISLCHFTFFKLLGLWYLSGLHQARCLGQDNGPQECDYKDLPDNKVILQLRKLFYHNIWRSQSSLNVWSVKLLLKTTLIKSTIKLIPDW